MAALVWGVVRLSERRAAFVSAVTHELRTPLTTFRLYAEMLAEGMVPDSQRRQEYLLSLRREADRLAHLVENVLSYARLERGRRGAAVGPIALAELVDRAEQRLAAHAEQAGMTLVVEGREEAAGAVVLANPSAVEQVLLNLVDNACKYAATATDRRIHVALRCARARRRCSPRPRGGSTGRGPPPDVPVLLQVGPRRRGNRPRHRPGPDVESPAGPRHGWRPAARPERCRWGMLCLRP